MNSIRKNSKHIKVCEYFESIQGEGKYAGYPALFIRVSGCTRNCKFCDSKYHKDGKYKSIEDLIKIIQHSNLNIVIWTGGEPLLYMHQIYKVYLRTIDKSHHIETNGDLLTNRNGWFFKYICVSPKDMNTATRVITYEYLNYDIKVVTDLKLNRNFLDFATILMPLTNDYEGPIDKEIQQKVWQYCVLTNKRFCLRQHICVWGLKKKI